MSTMMKFILTGIIYVLTIITGIWLSKLGKPLNNAVFTVHKLVALGFAVFAGIYFYRTFKKLPDISVFIPWLLIAGISVLGLFISGGLLSFDKQALRIFLWIHRVLPLLILGASLILFFLTKKNSI